MAPAEMMMLFSPLRVHGDDGDSRGGGLGRAHVRDVHAGSCGGGLEHLAVGVVPHCADKADCPAQQAGCDGLVGALAAGVDGEPGAVDRLPRQREAFAVDGQVGVEGPDDDDPAARSGCPGTHSATSASTGLGIRSEAPKAATVMTRPTTTTVR